MPADFDGQQNTTPHQPLKRARDIRLVRIGPKTDSLYGFTLELSTTSLENPIPYVALSYTWEAAELDQATGNVAPALEYSIPYLGGSIKVTENLLDFMQLAAKNGNAPQTYYWIDQISINQADLTERFHQVAMMGSIYKKAHGIRIWLGKNDPSAQFLWVYQSFIPSLLRVESKLRERGISLGSNSWDCSTPELIEDLGAEVCKQWRESREAFFWFFYTRRWFLRAWIMQEVSLQDVNLIHVSCGKKVLEWEVFNAFTQLLERSCWHHSLPLLYVPWAKKLLGPMVPLLNLLKGRHYVAMKTRGGRELESWLSNFVWDIGPQNEHQIWYSIFLHFLRTTRFMSAKNPVDHIYSLLGIMAEFLPPGMECPISPRYDTSTMSVFKDFATQIFENTPSLYLLSMIFYKVRGGEASNPGDRADWPSWVPDFSDETSFAQSLSTTVYLVSGRTQRYNASRLDAMQYQHPTVRDTVLTVHGAQVGIIEKRNHIAYQLAAKPNHPFFSGPGYSNTFLEKAINLLQQISDDPYLSSMLPTLDEVVIQVYGHVEQDTVENHPFELLACESFANRRWYLTTGGYLGAGPVSLIDGDEVWLLKGAKMPIILRRVNEKQHLLVGESYLHGAMYGEFMTDEVIGQMSPVEII
ncbi:hypothetical protein DM02DRAFT_688646 [Periconia macrospinosa]|uniref:Heterokaryon incompatibility domain-containing protein n=1 Tax=Periconia macrospinosa TaxID=97972 RepID=A0A2V1DD35_9PLEO|nr:hypothetical protein DM02DRAFT_688646 [Periconia macrospinosa]